LADEAATLAAGAALSYALAELSEFSCEGPLKHAAPRSGEQRGGALHLHLSGGLGVGKTTLVRGMLRAMGVSGAVKSPTYTLVEPYQTASREVFHFDLYRLGNAHELELLGVRDYFRCGALCVFEWPSKGAGALPAPSLILTLSARNEGRQLQIEACDEAGRALKRALKARLKS